MTEPTSEEIQELFDQVIVVLDGKHANLQASVIADLIAALSLNFVGADPYDTARKIYRHAKQAIADNLAASRISTKQPRGSKLN